ncbi:tetratricopeptide repeat protein [Nannocystis sp. SCPEA4]|uniref:tetratricopeptide repeat protein n=1 Tax=Nannocystis sp. SCPEA4 TaxID=2996787 RepID=UPI00226FA9DF|nr:tetratricopeptide repeat protein [Nannocystis sp. SCPEA4]
MSEEDKAPATGQNVRMELPTWDHSRSKRRGGDAGPQEDAFVTGVKQAGRTARARGPLVIGGVIAVLAVLVGIIVVYNSRQTASAQATRQLATAARYESEAEVGDPALLLGANKGKPVAPIVKDEAERAAAVNKALDGLDASAAGSDAALAGTLVRATGLLRVGDPAGAEALYREFLGKAGAGHPLLFSAREGLAFAREAQNDLDGALAELETLAGQKGAFYRDMALWHKGRILERQGKTDAALEVYRQYIAEYPLQQPSIAQNDVRKRLEELDPKALAGEPAPESPIQVMDAPPGAPTP